MTDESTVLSDSEANESQKPYWIAVGASAGGLDALKDLLSAFDTNINATIIIAQHLDPKHPTLLKDLLSRSTRLPVHLVEENIRPQPGEIYIISPGHNALVEQGQLQLKPAAEVGPKPSASMLMTSLAEDQGEQCIGVILSGTGTDGSEGVMAIKSANGLVITQSEETAKYSGMPKAAVDTGFVDLTLPPAAIAHEIQDFIVSAGKTLSKLSVPKVKSSLEKIFQRIYDQTGYDFSGYKMKTIQRRIARRMAVHKVVTLDDYVTLFLSSGKEVESLFKDLLISVTSFFRDKQAFEDLALTLDKLLEETEDQDQLRIWVPGCANGEEAYSIAILLQQARSRLQKEVPFQVFATDIDEFALSQARRGIFSQSQVKEVPDELLKKYFTLKGDQYFIQKRIRDQVVFARQNVIMDPPFSRLDLISCRNLLIYFSAELQKQVFKTFHFALNSRGYLFLGKSEAADPELFEPLVKQSQIFVRKKTSISKRRDQASSAASLLGSRKHKDDQQPALSQEKKNVAEQIDRMLIEKLLPTAAVLDSEGQVMHLRGNVSPYLSFPQGRIDTNILSLIRDELKIDTRALLQKARQEGQASTQALFYNQNQAEKALFLNMKEVELEESGKLYVLTFTEVDLSEAFISGTGLLSEEGQISNENLRREINVFKERLQSSIEDLETTNEELQSTNEELQSANEELQSTNEELQTANEELQSTNEELSTVNEELEVKTYELEQANSHLENMLAHMNENIILVDHRLRVQRFTARASEFFDLVSSDLGQTITTLGINLDLPNFRQALLNAIEKNAEEAFPVKVENEDLLLRLVPYQSNHNQQVEGVMLFFEHKRHARL
ncbi:two-component system, chemotaxis family, CheB/CheR fusion protein [Marinospirillum celere]|uniref:protein-glutamate O-methyltransferase n=1 Tax=Marinospirillum celere TaxID=1122252 RepID=A0A1I1DTJ7_9GAMM|nr:chemotaxis protein CheB [Marinospirillum celere]SFB78285.1 two-component system, chemotaxis family, CheB/CheR fusion protein [Marinospirillum celere]